MDKQIVDMSKEELNTILRPMGKATYKHLQEIEPELNKKRLAKPNDRIQCSVCKKYYNRSGSAKHKRTVFHQERANLQKKLIDLLLN
jgi:hypothetical protein